MPEPIISKLTEVGFSDKEAKMYLAGLRTGPDTVQNLARAAKINRATAYVILQSLIDRGLASYFTQGKKSFYAMEDPEILEKLMEYEEENVDRDLLRLQESMLELKSLYNLAKNQPQLYFYEGKPGLLQAMDDYYGKEASDHVYEYFSIDQVLKMFPNYHVKHGRKSRGATYEYSGIYAHNDGPLTEKQRTTYFTSGGKLHYMPKKYPVASDVIIDDKRVALISLQGNLIGLIIENQDIAKTQKVIFDMVTQGLNKIETQK
ncbi:TrmB family transcriptional regulator [Patescibacteria group bacterium]